MSLARHFWNAFRDLAEVVGSLEGNDIPDVESPKTSRTQHKSSSVPLSTSEQNRAPESEPSGATASIESRRSDAAQHPQSEITNAEEVNTSSVSESGLIHNTEPSGQNAEPQREGSIAVVEGVSQQGQTSRVNQELNHRNRILQQNNVRHLKWQDNASMRIRDLADDIQARKQQARAAKEAGARAQAAMRERNLDLERRLRESEEERVRMARVDNAQAVEALESRLREVETRLDAQGEGAERAVQASTPTCQQGVDQLRDQLTQAEGKKAEVLAGKELEIEILQKRVDTRDSEIVRLKKEVEDHQEAERRAISEKDGLYQAKLDAKDQVERLKEENESLAAKRQEAALKASEAEGRAKAYHGQLVASKTTTREWERLYNKTKEDARDENLSAYAGETPHVAENSQLTTATACTVSGPSDVVEKLQREMDELQQQNSLLTKSLADYKEAWKVAEEGQKTWEETLCRQWEKENQETLVVGRAADSTSSERDATEQKIRQDAMEQTIRQECQKEKDEAFAQERENIRVQWEARKCSLRGQYAVKLKSDTARELQKLRRSTIFDRQKRSKVKRRQVKWVLKKATSRAVEAEQSRIQLELRQQFETDFAAYKARFESEHAKTRAQSEAQNGTGSSQQEIEKRDKYIEAHKSRLKQAYKDKHESEAELKTAKAENERLSRDVATYKTQQSVLNQSKSEAQISSMTQDFVRVSKLLTEIATMGLDDTQRQLLHSLLLANEVIDEIRSTIEQGQAVDDGYFRKRLEQVVESSDDFEGLDPRERPTLHAQLEETYPVIGGLINVLAGERGAGTDQDLLRKTYRDKVKGKEKEGSGFGPSATSRPTAASSGGPSAAPAPEPNGSNQPSSIPTEYQHPTSSKNPPPTTQPPTTIQAPNTTTSDSIPQDMDLATALALQGIDESDLATIDFDSIDWSNPTFFDSGVQG